MTHVKFEGVDQIGAAADAVVEDTEGVDHVAAQLVRNADTGGLGHVRVADERAFDFGGTEPVAADFDDIVHAANDPEVAVIVAACAVACKVPALLGEFRPVLFDIAIGVSPDCTGHTRPGPLDDEIAVLVRLAGGAIFAYDFGFDCGERQGGAARFEGDNWCGCDHEAAGFRLPPGVHNRAVFATDHTVVPAPCFRVYRFSYASKEAQARQVVLFGPGIAEAHQAANGGWRRVQDSNAVVLDEFPVTIGVGIVGGAFIHEAGGAEDERRVDDVTMSGNPAGVGGAPPEVVLFEVEDVLQGGGGVDLIAATGMEDAFGSAGCAGCVENE